MGEQLNLLPEEIAEKYGIPTSIQRDPGGCAAWVAIQPDALSDELKQHAYVNPNGMVQIPAKVFREYGIHAETRSPSLADSPSENSERIVFSRQASRAEK